jgi:hypothetical protein
MANGRGAGGGSAAPRHSGRAQGLGLGCIFWVMLEQVLRRFRERFVCFFFRFGRASVRAVHVVCCASLRVWRAFVSFFVWQAFVRIRDMCVVCSASVALRGRSSVQ